MPKPNSCITVLLAGLALLVFGAASSSGQSIDLVGYLDMPAAAYDTDVWGWVDPVTQIEYALVGNNATGLQIVDVSNPAHPFIVSTVAVPSFDIKTYGNYVYTVDGNYGFVGMDGCITDITDPENPVFIGNIRAGHNLFVDHLGYLYLTFPGLQIYDLNPDPENPVLVWEKLSTEGHDVTVIGDRLYDYHGYDGTFIYDIADRSNPVLLGSITDPSISFHHSGWTSADESFLFINDEMAVHPNPDIIVFDISKPNRPKRAAEIADSTATAHNSYRIGDYLYVSYYTAGFRVYNISDPRNPVLADEYDTTPLVGEGVFKGAWGCYPFSPSGWIFINDRPDGFFIFAFNGGASGIGAPEAANIGHFHNFPNPFNPATTVSYDLKRGGRVRLDVFSVTGRKIRALADRVEPAGTHRVDWDGRDDGGARVSSGVYFCRLTAGSENASVKMVLTE
jgi:hypothetical protein